MMPRLGNKKEGEVIVEGPAFFNVKSEPIQIQNFVIVDITFDEKISHLRAYLPFQKSESLIEQEKREKEKTEKEQREREQREKEQREKEQEENVQVVKWGVPSWNCKFCGMKFDHGPEHYYGFRIKKGIREIIIRKHEGGETRCCGKGQIKFK